MSDEKLDLIEAKHKELSDLVQKKVDYLNQTKIAIDQLTVEREKAMREISEMSGARDAYGSVVNLYRPPVAVEAEAVDAPVAPVANDPVVVDGTAEVVA